LHSSHSASACFFTSAITCVLGRLDGFLLAAALDLDDAFRQPARTHAHGDGEAQQVGVLELEPSGYVGAVIVEDFVTGLC
jgi:hypothetical protein